MIAPLGCYSVRCEAVTGHTIAQYDLSYAVMLFLVILINLHKLCTSATVLRQNACPLGWLISCLMSIYSHQPQLCDSLHNSTSSSTATDCTTANISSAYAMASAG